MNKVIAVAILALGTGCTTTIVRPYVGEQPIWPTGGGSVVNTQYKLPVFMTLPSAPYSVIGELRIESPFYATPEVGQMPTVVKKAQELGAHAIAMVQPQSFFQASTSVSKTPSAKPAGPVQTSNTFIPDVFKGGSLIAIKWIGAPPEGLPAKYAKIGGGPGLPPPPPVEVVATPKPEKPTPPKPPKSNFGPLRPAPEKKTKLTPSAAPATATAATTTPATPDPRKAPAQ